MRKRSYRRASFFAAFCDREIRSQSILFFLNIACDCGCKSSFKSRFSNVSWVPTFKSLYDHPINPEHSKHCSFVEFRGRCRVSIDSESRTTILISAAYRWEISTRCQPTAFVARVSEFSRSRSHFQSSHVRAYVYEYQRGIPFSLSANFRLRVDRRYVLRVYKNMLRASLEIRAMSSNGGPVRLRNFCCFFFSDMTKTRFTLTNARARPLTHITIA